MTKRYNPAELVEGFTGLHSLPTVYLRVKAVVENPVSRSQDLVQELSNDPALSARVLRLVNSPLYGRGRAVDTLRSAVEILGNRAVHDLVLASSVTAIKPDGDEAHLDMTRHWRESIKIGVVARALGVQHKMSERERLFVEGLLSRIGVVVMHDRIGAAAAVVARHANTKGIALHEAQRQFIGCHYGQVGAALLRQWQLPERICLSIEQHLDPAGEDETLDVSVLRLAALLAPELEETLTHEELEGRMALTGPAHLELDVEEVSDLLEQSRTEVRQIEQVLLPAA